MWKFKSIKEFALSWSCQDIWILCRLSCCELDFFIAAWRALCHWECQSAMVQVMVCCLNVPGHYLHWCGISISEILCQSPDCNFMWDVPRYQCLKLHIERDSHVIQWCLWCWCQCSVNTAVLVLWWHCAIVWPLVGCCHHSNWFNPLHDD